jgi:biotin carboxyl carrier protein
LGSGGSEEDNAVEYEFLIDSELHHISLEKKGHSFIISHEGETYEADIQQISPNCISILTGNSSKIVYYAKDRDKLYLSIDGHQCIVSPPSEEENQIGEGAKSQEDELLVKAPMPGKVIKVNVSENEKVRKNQTLAIVEAMKMENEIKSSIDGTVKKIFAADGDLVDSENPLIELEKSS